MVDASLYAPIHTNSAHLPGKHAMNMRLNTPKKYRVGKRQKRHMVSSLRWLWLWILTPIIIFGGYQIYERRDEFGPPVQEFIRDRVNDAQSGLATAAAPTPLPTSDPSQRIARADALWTQGAVETALDEYEQAKAGAPNDARVYYQYTYGLLIEGRAAEALPAAEETVTANPFSSDAWAIRAFALARNDRYPEAVASALQALSLDPNNATALAYMALAYSDAGMPSMAEQTLDRALEIDPENPAVFYVRGLWNLAANFDQAAYQADLQTAYELAPNLPHIAVELAWANWGLGAADVGLEQLEAVVEQNPNNLDALYALGFFWMQTYGDPNKARDYIERCVTADPANVSCLDYLATIQLTSLELDDALQTYDRLMNTNPTDPKYYLRAGRTYANAGNCNVASPWLQEGYEMEQALEEPNTDRLAAFEEFLITCGVPINRVYSTSEEDAATAEPSS